MTAPTSPIDLNGTASHLPGAAVEVPRHVIDELDRVCEVIVTEQEVAEASRDWWPLAMHWSLAGSVPRRAAAIARPTGTEEVSAVLAICHREHIPVTAAGGRSGVNGASAPVFGGIVLDLTAMQGILGVDAASGVVDVLAGTFGPDLERELNDQYGLSVGHFPQSFDIATVGGWVACRGAGQYSTRYGKIEHMVVGLEVVLADGRVVHTGGSPASAVGPELGQLFLGSEGTLGVITRVWLRTHPVAPAQRTAAYAFTSFEAGLDACRRILRRGSTPAVLRLYDEAESKRGQGADGTQHVLLVLDEGDPLIIDAAMAVVAEECAEAAPYDAGAVERWLAHRNDTSGLQALTRKQYVVDTMEIAAPWSKLAGIFTAVREAQLAVPHARASTCHLSHSYNDGACLYFTFAATPPPEAIDRTYVAMWDAGQRTVLAHGGNLSHHHGVGLNRGRFMAEALGSAFDVLVALKDTLDPHGVLNPGKLGLPSPFGVVEWP